VAYTQPDPPGRSTEPEAELDIYDCLVAVLLLDATLFRRVRVRAVRIWHQ